MVGFIEYSWSFIPTVFSFAFLLILVLLICVIVGFCIKKGATLLFDTDSQHYPYLRDSPRVLRGVKNQ